MKHIWLSLCILTFFIGCSAKPQSLHVESIQVVQLSQDLQGLGPRIDPEEARLFAYEALLYPQVLAQNYGLVYPPTFHNLLINVGVKDRGLCYQWSEDMITHLKNQHYKSFDLRWGVANKGELDEHNSVVVVAKGASFQTGILIDPWRRSGVLYWAKLGDDPDYKWVENKERSHYYGTIER